MSYRVEPVTSEFVAVVKEVVLSQPLSGSLISELVRTIDKYAVVIFPGQNLTQNQILEFAQQFGELEGKPKYLAGGSQKLLDRDSKIFDVSNIDETGKVAARDDPQVRQNIGAQMWHTDGAYKHRPARYSMLGSVKVTSWGGETQFADLRAAYDTLDQRTLDLIEDKVGEHDFFHWLVDRLGFPQVTEQDRLNSPPSLWPLVRAHPGSGRKVLWVETALSKISGITVPEARQLATDLLTHATQRERVYTHVWTLGDLVMWDNRSVLHRGRPFDLSEPRQLHRASTCDDSYSLPSTSFAIAV